MTNRPTKVLIVDDSAVVRKLIADALRAEPDVVVVGGASDPFIARELILEHEPDVLTLDIEMPRMDGLTFLSRIMEHRPMPVIVVSSLTQAGSAASLEAMRLGAIDVIGKPSGPGSVGDLTAALVRRIRELRAAPALNLQPRRQLNAMRHHRWAPVRPHSSLVAIGASTGGTQAIEAVLTRLPASMPPIVIVQHMPPVFTRAFAERLDKTCPMSVIEAQGGDVLKPGVAYVAPGDRHLIVERFGLELRAALRSSPPVHYQRPAVDVLFASVARLRGLSVVGVVLTGMGRDGAEGLLALRQSGAATIAEAEESCVVFGMPKEAIAIGAAQHVATLFEMPDTITTCLNR